MLGLRSFPALKFSSKRVYSALQSHKHSTEPKQWTTQLHCALLRVGDLTR